MAYLCIIDINEWLNQLNCFHARGEMKSSKEGYFQNENPCFGLKPLYFGEQYLKKFVVTLDFGTFYGQRSLRNYYFETVPFDSYLPVLS